AVVGGDVDLARVANDVLVGEDVPLVIDAEAGSDDAGAALEHPLDDGAAQLGGAHGGIAGGCLAACGDGDDGGGDPPGDVAEALLEPDQVDGVALGGELEASAGLPGLGGREGRRRQEEPDDDYETGEGVEPVVY